MMNKYITLIIIKFMVFFSLNIRIFYYPIIHDELDCFNQTVLKSTMSGQYYIFKDEWEKIERNWNNLKELVLKKFFQYYQIWYNFAVDGYLMEFMKEIKFNKFLFKGFKTSFDKHRATSLEAFYNYDNTYKKNDSAITFLILPESSQYYSKILQDKIARFNNKLGKLNFDRTNKVSWRFIQLYWNSVLKLRVSSILDMMHSELKLKNVTFRLKEKFFIFSGYENEKPNYITYLYRYYLFNNNHHKLDISLK